MSTSRKARIAGALYLVFGALGPFVLLYVPNTLEIDGSPAATASAIATHETLLRLGIAGDLAGGLMALVVSLALFWLFEKFDRALATLVVILGGILPCAIYFLNSLNWCAALLIVRGDAVMPAFAAGPQRDELVMLFMRLDDYGVIVSFVFAGLWLLPIGALILKSRALPRIIGWWLIAAGIAYLATVASSLLFPQYLRPIARVATPLEFGELALLFWLLIMGAREPAAAP
jgi:hypothetical protein